MKALLKGITPEWLRRFSRSPRRTVHAIRSAVSETWPAKVMRFRQAYEAYLRTGIVAPGVHELLRTAYRVSDGRITESAVNHLASLCPAVPEPDGPVSAVGGALAPLSSMELGGVQEELDRNGICVLGQRLDPRWCDELLEYARSADVSPRGDHLNGRSADFAPFARQPLTAPTYWFAAQNLCEQPIVQRLMTDPTLLRIAQQYLRLEPMLNIVTMWWSVPHGDQADSASAQLYHYDLDRPRFLKVFFYLQDVATENGPHAYVRGTHRTKSRAMRAIRRFSDEEVAAACGSDRMVEVTGPRGTIVIADTRGLHKGTPVRAGSRLMLQLEYVSDRFGYPQPIIRLNESFGEQFRRFQRRHPRFLCRFTDDRQMTSTNDLRIV